MTSIEQDAPGLMYLTPETPWSRYVPYAIASALVHLLVAVGATLLPPSPKRIYRDLEISRLKPDVTPLYAPSLKELTQIEKNTTKVAKEFNLSGLRAPKESPQREVAASGGSAAENRRVQMPVPGTAPAPPSPPAASIEPPPPQIAAILPPTTGNGEALSGLANLPKTPPPAEKPKIAFESVRAAQVNTPSPSGSAIQPAQQQSIDQIVRRSAPTMAGQAVGDQVDSVAGSAGSSGGKSGSRLELMSDPQGVDFRSWLTQVLASVRRNWLAVIPESARLGRQGKSVLQFAVGRDGRIIKLVIAIPSGAEALDRAAVAGLSASDPLPPLPAEFRGQQVRLQMAFTYVTK